ncbi:MAG: hypothetical protein HN855_05565 [Anaerolineae bacterium]|mgnify:CR=1 FL=1|jgi:uncharacterized membrane protein (GlpM family)|nr:hypothetical protein [Anaerolineae bacterium]MBT7072567.1 hypothetical protein [Anaerolineae bacterium]MBT7324607.1 hypothetical protein [Anaerolineae bacterium]
MKSQDVLPVILSVVIIVIVAILEKQSKVIAAITATMPLTAALALWIVYTSANGDKTATSQFSLSMIFGFIPTFFFMVAAWLAARAGMKLSGILLAGYGTWAVGAGIIYMLRQVLGIG